MKQSMVDESDSYDDNNYPAYGHHHELMSIESSSE